MGSILGFLVFAFVLAAFLPYNELTKKNNLKLLRKQINDGEISGAGQTADRNFMERIYKYSERFYPYVKEKIKLDVFKKYSHDIVVAGLSETITPEGIIGAKYFLALSLFGYFLIFALLLTEPAIFFMTPIGLIIGYVYPDTFLKRCIKKRQWQIQKELPSVLNTLAIITEAGLGLFESIEKVCEIRSGEFIKELKKVNEEVKMGFVRKEAFLRLAERCEVHEVNTFVSALLQLLEKGASGIAKFLRDHAGELWHKRISKAREIGAKASLKLFLPMLFFVLPSTLIFLAGPVVIQVVEKMF